MPEIGQFKVFGELSTITYSTHRELFPVRTLGRINPKGYTRGGRTIAGTLVFTVFDRYALYDLNNGLNARLKEMRQDGLYSQAWYTKKMVQDKLVFLADEMPPFDVIVTLANETYPAGSRIVITGIRVSNEGQIMSIQDMMTETTMEYTAVGIEPLAPLVDGQGR